jgi:DNA polymerase-3 subunit gamma/tau
MEEQRLNLARKWRSKGFDQIIGQDLSMRMLKNSLFMNYFFPVYLFAGQRGCGKTSTARIFAAAINCEKLILFQRDPKNTIIPCLECASCRAMDSGSHPDFIEIDAASHTGVDNVRQIIEAASLLPVLGSKKVYLIDEAHMLSKAAFNAFLKILEEPPKSVLFILATTDDGKIIETVRSRCFQLLFKPIGRSDLVRHLISICQSEQIVFDEAGLQEIVKETSGSARDAINLLERVRFAKNSATKEDVVGVLGYIGDAQLCRIVELIISESSPEGLLSELARLNLEHYAPDLVWGRLLLIIRGLVWAKYGVALNEDLVLEASLLACAEKTDIETIISLYDFCCQQEHVFNKTSNKHLFLSMIFVRLWAVVSRELKPAIQTKTVVQPVVQTVSLSRSEPISQGSKTLNDSWELFLKKVATVSDQLIVSLFSQAKFKEHNVQQGVVKIVLNKKFKFFSDVFEKIEAPWYAIAREVFGSNVRIEPLFEEDNSPVALQKNEVRKTVSQPIEQRQTMNNQRSTIDISNKNAWPLANVLLEHIPGILTEEKDEKN